MNFPSLNKSKITDFVLMPRFTLGIAMNTDPPHTTLAYGMDDTHGLLYNLYGDKELGLNLVPQTVYNMQSSFYPSIIEQYGAPLDTRHDYTKSKPY